MKSLEKVVIKLKLSSIFKILIYSWLALLAFPLAAFLGKALILLGLMLLPMLLWKPTRKLILSPVHFLMNRIAHLINVVSDELDKDSPSFHILKPHSKEAVYAGDIYDEKAKRYHKFYLSLDELRTTLIYGNPQTLLATVLPQVSFNQNIVILDSEGTLYPPLREVMPLHYIAAQELPVDPMKLGAKDAYTIFNIAFHHVSHEIRTKLKSLIYSYHDQLARNEKPSLRKFLEDFLEKMKGSASNRLDLANIEKVQDLCCDLPRSSFLNSNSEPQNIPSGFLYLDLSNITNESARIIYALTALETLHHYWGHCFVVIDGSLLPLGDQEGREFLRKIEHLLKHNFSLCIATDGCAIDATLLNFPETVFIGNCIEDYRLSHAFQKMFPQRAPHTLRPMEYLVKHRDERALLICPPLKTAKEGKDVKEEKETISILEADFEDNAGKAYDMLQMINQAKRMPRPAILSLCGYDEAIADKILERMVKLGYVAYKTEAVKDRYIPVVKLMKKGTDALEEYSLKLQGQKKLEEMSTDGVYPHQQ